MFKNKPLVIDIPKKSINRSITNLQPMLFFFKNVFYHVHWLDVKIYLQTKNNYIVGALLSIVSVFFNLIPFLISPNRALLSVDAGGISDDAGGGGGGGACGGGIPGGGGGGGAIGGGEATDGVKALV